MGFWDKMKKYAENAATLTHQGLQRAMPLYNRAIESETTTNLGNYAFNTLDYSFGTISAVPQTFRTMARDPETRNIVKADLRILAFDVSLLALVTSINEGLQAQGQASMDPESGWLSTDTLLCLGLSLLALTTQLFIIRQYYLKYYQHTPALSLEASRVLPQARKNKLELSQDSLMYIEASRVQENVTYAVTLTSIAVIKSCFPSLAWIGEIPLNGRHSLSESLPELSYEDKLVYFNVYAELVLAFGLSHWMITYLLKYALEYATSLPGQALGFNSTIPAKHFEYALSQATLFFLISLAAHSNLPRTLPKGYEPHEGCFLHKISQWPKNPKNLEAYKNNYVLLHDLFDDKSLYFIKDNNEVEEVSIEDLERFTKTLDKFSKGKHFNLQNPLRLDANQIKQLITLNGGHTLPRKYRTLFDPLEQYQYFVNFCLRVLSYGLLHESSAIIGFLRQFQSDEPSDFPVVQLKALWKHPITVELWPKLMPEHWQSEKAFFQDPIIALPWSRLRAMMLKFIAQVHKANQRWDVAAAKKFPYLSAKIASVWRLPQPLVEGILRKLKDKEFMLQFRHFEDFITRMEPIGAPVIKPSVQIWEIGHEKQSNPSHLKQDTDSEDDDDEGTNLILNIERGKDPSDSEKESGEEPETLALGQPQMLLQGRDHDIKPPLLVQPADPLSAVTPSTEQKAAITAAIANGFFAQKQNQVQPTHPAKTLSNKPPLINLGTPTRFSDPEDETSDFALDDDDTDLSW